MGLAQGALPVVILGGIIGLLTKRRGQQQLMTCLKASDNNQVRAIAMTGSIIGFVASAVCSFAYLTMVAGNADSGLPGNIDTVVMWLLAAITVIHFGLVFLTQYKSTQSQIDERMSTMVAAGNEEMLRLMEQGFMQQIPELAQRNADQLVRQLAGNFSSLTNADAAAAVYRIERDDQPALSASAEPAAAMAFETHTAEPNLVSANGNGSNGTQPVTFRSDGGEQ